MSKARSDNKSDKVSSDLDTPTDMPQAAVGKISASLNALSADVLRACHVLNVIAVEK